MGPEEMEEPQNGGRRIGLGAGKGPGFKEQYFTCHEKGIGRLYDSRKPRYYRVGRCKFPAGHGWKVGVKTDCVKTSLKITHVGLDDKGRLSELKFEYWSRRDRLDHIYRYVPDQGMTNAWKQ